MANKLQTITETSIGSGWVGLCCCAGGVVEKQLFAGRQNFFFFCKQKCFNYYIYFFTYIYILYQKRGKKRELGKDTQSHFSVGVNNGTLVESIEIASSTHGVRAHILIVQPVANIQLWQHSIFRDAVHRVTGRTPDGALEFRQFGHMIRPGNVQTVATENFGFTLGMVKQDTIE